MAKENIYLESKPRYEVLDVLIKGTTREPMRYEVRLIIKNPGGSPLASYVPGNYNGSIMELQPGDFTVERHIRLPKYIADGNYFIDLHLHEPYRQNFFEASDCQMLHVEGFFDPYARPITLPCEGFLGLESASNSNGL